MPNENFIEYGTNIDDYSSSPSFEIIEEIKINNGMFISTSQAAMTFFHQIVPSQTVQVHLNPFMTNNNHYINSEAIMMRVENQGSFFRKFKGYVMGNLVKPSKKIASLTVFVFALLLMHCVYLKEEMEIWKPNFEDVKGKYCGSAIDMKRMRQSFEIMKWNESKEEVWFVCVNSVIRVSVVLKKIGIFLTISLALSTIWATI